jgi:hypothetical protein
MTPTSHSSPCSSVYSSFSKHCAKAFFVLAMVTTMVSAAFAAPATTTTALSISATSVPYQTPIILTATVTSNGSPVTAGLVLFCEATATFCENNSALGIAQLTFPGATASVKIGSGPIGNHSYKAVFRANNSYATSLSNTVTYAVTGTYLSTSSLTSTGTVGNYSLFGTVSGIGSLTTAPTGVISFQDASDGNNVLGTQHLVVSTLSTTFVQNQPFAIGGPGATNRSVAIASAYLDGDNNLDVVTGDAVITSTPPALPLPDNSTITVLLGNGDGTFKPKVNYPGCSVGSALKILLADFNRDGNTDIALGCSDGTTVAGGNGFTGNGGLVIMLGNGDGSFQTPVFHSTGDVASIATGDFNGDGILDIVLTDRSQQNVIVFLGNGDGTFTQEPLGNTISTPAPAHGVVVADFDGDGNDDIAYAVGAVNQLSDLYVARGKGDGTFKTPTVVASQIGEFLTAGDTNADNNADIVASSITEPGGTQVGNSLFVLLGKGDGTFKQAVSYLSDIPSDPHLADVNGDGIPDIIAGGSTGALVYQGNGNGTFQPYQEPTIGGFTLTYAVNAGDYNNDGNADLIGTDADTPRAAVSLSQVAQISNASALTNVAVFPLGSGIHNVDASYSGDSVYLGSLSDTVPLTAAPVNTSLALVASPGSAILAGDSVTLTATLSPFTVGPPTTTTDGDLVNFFSGATLLGSGHLLSGVATLTTTALPIGTDSLTAVFPGDSNYNPSTSSASTLTVSTVTLSSSLNPSTFGQSVTFTATVLPSKTGSVTFLDGGTSIGASAIVSGVAVFSTSSLAVGAHNVTAQYNSDTSNVVVQVVNKATTTVAVTTSPNPSTFGGSVTITASVPAGVTGTITFTSGTLALGSGTIASGAASITTTLLTPPSDVITATYNGDTNYNSAVGTATQTVAKATPTSALTSSPNPSLSGSPVTLTDTLPSNVTGTVTFTTGSTTLGTSTVTGGIATLITSTLPIGSDSITATYNGDGNFNSSVATATQTVGKANPTLTVSTSGPSTFGQSVTITASVPNGPTGTITITSGGVTLGSGPITATNGTVTITTTALPVGSDVITASYGGDATNNSATGTTTQSVTRASPTETLDSSVNPSAPSQSVTFTAKLPSSATGTVTFTSGSTALGTSNLTNGIATISTSTLPSGADPITATYNGDVNNNTATASLTQTVNKSTPTVTVTTSGPSTFGNPVTVTTTLPPGTTGTVTITSGGTTLGSGPVNSTTGTVTITTTILPVGSDPITATFGGDTNNNPATGSTTQTVNKATPTVGLTSSVNPSSFNQSVTFTASLPTNTTGTVTFLDGPTTLGTGVISGGVATFTTSTLTAGVHPITASYGGDANDNSAVSAPLSQTVNKATPVLPIPVPSSTSPVVGTTVTITETVPPGVSGPVTFSNGSTPLGTAPIVGGVATITVSNLPLGTDPITASTPGDNNNNPATSPPASVTVVKTAPTVSVTSSLNPSIINQPVTFTATAPAGATGTITFLDGPTILGTGTLNAGGQTTLTTSTLIVGSHTITVSYGGDTNNNPATSVPLTQIVNKATPVIPPPVVSAPSTPVNTPETITETVPTGVTGTVTFSNGTTPIGSAPIVGGVATITVSNLPVGTNPITATTSGDANNNPATSAPTVVTVTQPTPVLVAPIVSSNNPPPNTPVTITEPIPTGVSGPVTFFNGSTPLGTAPIVNGQATLTVPSLPVGTDPITVTAINTATSGTLTSPPTVVTVTQPTPVLVAPIVSSNNPPPNTPVTITEPIPSGVSGPVTFFNGSTPLGTAPIVNGQATLTVPSLPVGTNPITVTAINTATNGTLTSPPTQVTVAKVPVTVTLTSSANPANPGQAITFSVTVHAGATGTVTFLDGTTILGTGTINAAGIATFTTSTLTIGSHPITASYGGDSSYNASTSAVLTEAVGKIPTVTTIIASDPAQLLHMGVTFTANVTAPSPNATGTVTFMEGTTILGTSTLSANGGVVVTLTTNANAAYATTSLVTGPHQIVAVYSGDNTFAPSTSAPVPNIVEDFTNTNTGAASQPMYPGASTSYTFTLAPISATTFLNDVTVAVDGLPPGSTYTFTPSTIKAGSGSTQVVLNVQTSSSLSARNGPPKNSPGSRSELPIALGILGFVGLGTVRKLRHKMPRALLLLLLTLGSLLPIAALSGCAGGYFALNPTTYPLTVTGTEGPIQHAATASLIVQ